MKQISCIIALVALGACGVQPNNSIQLQAKVDSLQKQLENSYKPGLGEFMSGIQVHHAKLWFAGLNGNWQLADFEVHEIEESLDDAKTFCSERPELKSIDMINAPIDSVNDAIKSQNIEKFKSSFAALTTTCNSCHRATEHGFNVVSIPTVPPISNQDFKLQR